MKRTITLGVVALLARFAQATIPSPHSAFEREFEIKIQNESGAEWRLKRHYHSRRMSVGLFGFGWCTALDRRLLVTSHRIELKGCDESIIFKQDSKQVWRDQKAVRAIQRRQLDYVLSESSQEVARFDRWGRLIQYSDEQQNWIHLHYSAKDQLTKILIGTLVLQIEIRNSGFPLVQKLIVENRIWSFSYQGLDLIQVGEGAHSIESLKYDDFHNLTHYRSADVSGQVQYDSLRDLVLGVQFKTNNLRSIANQKEEVGVWENGDYGY